MHDDLANFARQGEIVIMAGAGVSAGKPSALPGWKSVNATIVQVLCQRLESALERPRWLSELMTAIDTERHADRFPPDYQAQLIEEMCGDLYFRALQSFDVDVINAGHDGIAALAAAGTLKAVVTTNFDRLIERALDKRGIEYVVAYDDVTYVEILQRLRAKGNTPLPILKIHGCVQDHLSMIDTLKQRKRGRSHHLRNCLDELQSGYWIYLGFSAADLETDEHYLGLVAGAARSAGATYVAYPNHTEIVDGQPVLKKGAKILMDAYGNRRQIVVQHVSAYLDEVCRSLEIPGPDPIPDDTAVGIDQFQVHLRAWADQLSPASAGLCMAAILEAIGQAEPAIRILDRLVREELHDQQDTDDYHALQLHYGRLGAAWGHFLAVPDLGGAASNISVETQQSLMRLLDSNRKFAASSWLTCLWLWLNNGRQAMSGTLEILEGISTGQWKGAQPDTDEEAADAWLSAAQVCIINSHMETINLVVNSADKALDYARQCGDVVRTARVVGLKYLAMAETSEDVPTLLQQHDPDFDEVVRVGDGFALGMRALALGRWYVGIGGLKLAQITDGEGVAQRALKFLEEAIKYFRDQGMDPWELFALVQQAKAFADLQLWDDAQVCMDTAVKGLTRFPILASHVYEVAGQVQTYHGHDNAADAFRAAVQAAEDSGLMVRRQSLMRYLDQPA